MISPLTQHSGRSQYTEFHGFVSGLAGLMGYLLGFGATNIAFRLFHETHSVTIPLNFKLTAAAFFLAVFVGIVSSIYPATLAARLDPNEALHAL